MLFDCIFEVTPVEEMQMPFSLQFLIVLPLIVVAVPAVTYTPLPDVDVSIIPSPNTLLILLFLAYIVKKDFPIEPILRKLGIRN